VTDPDAEAAMKACAQARALWVADPKHAFTIGAWLMTIAVWNTLPEKREVVARDFVEMLVTAATAMDGTRH
jgi:energy-converting hydrogenase Eha subunit B